MNRRATGNLGSVQKSLKGKHPNRMRVSRFLKRAGSNYTMKTENHTSRKMHAEPFSSPDTDGPSVALRFAYDAEVVELLKNVLHRQRSRSPWAGGWSKGSRCWWVTSCFWPAVRSALIKEGVELNGPAAHPGKRQVGFFEEDQKWDVKDGAWH